MARVSLSSCMLQVNSMMHIPTSNSCLCCRGATAHQHPLASGPRASAKPLWCKLRRSCQQAALTAHGTTWLVCRCFSDIYCEALWYMLVYLFCWLLTPLFATFDGEFPGKERENVAELLCTIETCHEGNCWLKIGIFTTHTDIEIWTRK